MALILAAFAMTAQTRQVEETTHGIVETRVETKPIAPRTEYRFSRQVGRGRLVLAQEGRPGSIRRTYEVRVVDGQRVARLVSEVRTEPLNKIYNMGRTGYQSSRSGYFRSQVLDMRASAYTPSRACNGRWAGKTATRGIPPGYGVVAVDPRVIRLGTRLFIEGYGYAIAADTGGAIRGKRIDLGMQSRREALRFGRRSVRVHVLSSR